MRQKAEISSSNHIFNFTSIVQTYLSVYYQKQIAIPHNTCVGQNTELQGVLFKNIFLWRTSLDLKLIGSDVNPRTGMMHLKGQIYSI